MGRPRRADEAGCIDHMLNRANRRDKLVFKDADYEAFERDLTEAVARHQLDLLCFCIMPNHWHICVRLRVDLGDDHETARSAAKIPQRPNNHLNIQFGT